MKSSVLNIRFETYMLVPMMEDCRLRCGGYKQRSIAEVIAEVVGDDNSESYTGENIWLTSRVEEIEGNCSWALRSLNDMISSLLDDEIPALNSGQLSKPVMGAEQTLRSLILP